MVTNEQESLACEMLKVHIDLRDGIISKMEHALYIKALSQRMVKTIDKEEPIQILLCQTMERTIASCEETIKSELELAKAVIKAYEETIE